MIILYLYIAVTVGILFGGFFSGSKVLDEKTKSYSEGWEAGYWLGYGEGLTQFRDEDPMSEYRDDELRAMRNKH